MLANCDCLSSSWSLSSNTSSVYLNITLPVPTVSFRQVRAKASTGKISPNVNLRHQTSRNTHNGSCYAVLASLLGFFQGST